MLSPSFCFSSAHRLAENARIREVCRRGKKVSAPFAAIYFAPNGLPHARLCVAIGKKQVAKAVRRNRLKRRVRESFRLHQAQLPAADIVLVIYKSCLSFTEQQQREMINQQWQRLALRFPASVPA